MQPEPESGVPMLPGEENRNEEQRKQSVARIKSENDLRRDQEKQPESQSANNRLCASPQMTHHSVGLQPQRSTKGIAADDHRCRDQKRTPIRVPSANECG